MKQVPENKSMQDIETKIPRVPLSAENYEAWIQYLTERGAYMRIEEPEVAEVHIP